jgi:hypothetical protein
MTRRHGLPTILGTGIAGVANMQIGNSVLGHAVAVRRVAGGAVFLYDSEQQSPMRVASQRVASLVRQTTFVMAVQTVEPIVATTRARRETTDADAGPQTLVTSRCKHASTTHTSTAYP